MHSAALPIPQIRGGPAPPDRPLYTALYMPATRTQVYLTEEQRRRLDELVRRRGVPMAQLVREALDHYLEETMHPDLETALATTFGAMPDLEVPSRDEWDDVRASD